MEKQSSNLDLIEITGHTKNLCIIIIVIVRLWRFANLLDDSPSLCCASGNSFLEMDVADLLSPYGPEKEMDSIGTFSSVPIACSFNSVALPCEFSCKEVLTPPQLSLAPCNSSSSSSSTYPLKLV